MHRAGVPALLLSPLLVLALVSGCGASDEPSRTAGSEPAAPGSSASAPSDVPSDDVATGIHLRMPNSTVVAPEGWTRGRKLSRGEQDADDPDSISFISLGEIEAFGSGKGASELGRTRIASSITPRAPRLRPVITLDGVPVYHVSGWVTSYRWIEEFGAIRNDRIVTLVFSFDKEISAAERQQVLDEVLPTFEWR